MKETVLSAITRIAKNEIGIEVKNPELVGYIELLEGEKEEGHSVSMVFKVYSDAKEFKLDNHTAQAEWFQKLPDIILPDHKKFLKNYLTSI